MQRGINGSEGMNEQTMGNCPDCSQQCCGSIVVAAFLSRTELVGPGRRELRLIGEIRLREKIRRKESRMRQSDSADGGCRDGEVGDVNEKS